LFAYGHTGAGKSFTVFGDPKKEIPGILSFVSDHILSKLQLQQEWLMTCQFVEIYNETIRDLMINPGENSPEIVIREDKGRTMLCGAREITLDEKMLGEGETFSIDEVIASGMRNRSVSSTNANA